MVNGGANRKLVHLRFFTLLFVVFAKLVMGFSIASLVLANNFASGNDGLRTLTMANKQFYASIAGESDQDQEARGTERCETTVENPSAVVLSPEDPWEDILTSDDAGGRVFLLRRGQYQTAGLLPLQPGTQAQPTVVKPYNCEAVTLYTSLRPSSFNIIAGMHIEALGVAEPKWSILFDGTNRGEISEVILRNNTILGGTIDAIRLRGDVHNILILGNHIDGGQVGHDIFVTGDSTGANPDAITITQNQLTKAHFPTPSEDMIQVRDVGTVRITSNVCTNGFNMEQCIDIKGTTKPLFISHNLFDGDQLHLAGTGADEAGGCMVIHEDDGNAEQHIIAHNQFIHCKKSIIRFASGTRDETSSALVQHNLFLQANNVESTMLIEIATNLQFSNNTMIDGELKLGNSDQTRLPQNLLFQNNIFYQVTIKDHTLAGQSSYSCTNNLFYQTLGDGFTTTPCLESIGADPTFVNATDRNFYLSPGSPALGAGVDQRDLGAFPIQYPAELLPFKRHLPIVLQ